MARPAVQEVEFHVEEVEGEYGELGEVAKAEQLEQRRQDGEGILDRQLNHMAAISKASRTARRQ